jgi:outer membrane protein, heavy metal efflux system
MKPAILIITLLSVHVLAHAQMTAEMVLEEIRKNNTTLRALDRQLEAEGINLRTGLTPPDPEVEYNYLWGNPALLGNRTDIIITQSIDFPTAYLHRSRIAGARRHQLELEYSGRILEVMYSARLLLADLIHHNALEREYRHRLTHAGALVDAYRQRLDQGEGTLPDLNRARLRQLNLEKEAALNQTERQTILSELAALNGGQAIEFTADIYPVMTIPGDFDLWYGEAEEANPALQWYREETGISRTQERLTRATSLPGFHAGYMSETVGAEHFRGITAGISIPLWENRNRLSHARARTDALEYVVADRQLLYYNQLRTDYLRAVTLRESLAGYREALQEYDNIPLLKKALELGEISLTEYTLELAIYYDTVDMIMETERMIHRALTGLYRHQSYPW